MTNYDFFKGVNAFMGRHPVQHQRTIPVWFAGVGFGDAASKIVFRRKIRVKKIWTIL